MVSGFVGPGSSLIVGLVWLIYSMRVAGLASTDTITSGGDNSRSGYQTNHNMNPSTVASNTFGQLWATKLTKQCVNPNGQAPEQIFSQPLVYTPGDTQYVYVATTTNAIYKIDAKTGAIVTSRSLHVPFLQKDLDSCTDLQPCIGVTGTGVIDPNAGVWYFTAKTYADQTGGTTGLLNGRYYAHAVDVITLAEKPGFPIALEGLIPTNNKRRSFVSGHQHQRPALLQTGGYIYAGFASHCVLWNYTGYIIGWSPQGRIVSVFTTEAGPESDDIRGGGIWMSGGGITSDDKGSIWLATGNGYASQLHGTSVPGRQPPSALEEAAVHFAQSSDGSLSPVDFFIPFEKEQLDGADKDLGTSPLVKLPETTFSCLNHRRIGVVTGKSGKTYFLNLDDLGGYQMGPNHGDAAIFVYQQKNSVYSGAAVYPREGGYVYIHVVQSPTTIFKFSCDGSGNARFTYVGQTEDGNAYIAGVGHGTTTSYKDQDGTGLVWVSDTQGYNLRIYSIQSNALKLIKTAQVNGVTKFLRPVFGDGKVYMGTTQGLLYCLGSPVNMPLTCTSPYDFGTVVVASSPPGANSQLTTGSITCTANITTTITSIAENSTNFGISSLPSVPFTLQAGKSFKFSASFTPGSPGPLATDVLIDTTNSIPLYSTRIPVTLKGIGKSLNPVLTVTPNTVTFEGVITSQNPDGVDQSIIYINQGSSPLTIIGIDYSSTSEQGPFQTNINTLGPFTWKKTPQSIPANSQAVVNINFKPPTSGNYAAYVRVRSNGGTKVYTVVATSSNQPKALFEFQSIDGKSWVQYDPKRPFSFGDVLEQVTRNRVFRLSNSGGSKAGRLSVTVSKPPIIAGAVIGARNNIDLGEGTSILPGQPQNSTLYCSVPKTQVNTASYNATAEWVINTGDPNLGKKTYEFYCHAISEQVGPLLSNGSAQYPYIGCFKENNPGRQLTVQLSGGTDKWTIDRCLKACYTQSYTFASMEYTNECWCGNALPTQKVPESNCNYACAANISQICGGNGDDHDGSYMSLFANLEKYDITKNITSNSGPQINPGVNGFNYLGCFTEPNGVRALSIAGPNSNTLTIQSCTAACASYQYAGAEYARECYCGNTLNAAAVQKPSPACSMTCTGNNTEYCGAASLLSVYKIGSNHIPPTSTSTSVDSSSTPKPSGPYVNPGVAPYSYIGCYTEPSGARALTVQGPATDTLTIASCLAACNQSGHLYAGAEYGRECYCGNTLTVGSTKQASSSCGMACAGNGSEYCGAGNFLSLYKASGIKISSTVSGTAASISSAPSPTGPVINPGTAPFVYAGCYSEPATARALTVFGPATDGLTIASCLAACKGYAYAGTEYGRECYCGNSLDVGSSKRADKSCSMPCAGNSSEYCGASNFLSLYKIPGSIVSFTQPTVVPYYGRYRFQGCWIESNEVRALTSATQYNAKMTVQICGAYCSSFGGNGTVIFGLEYATECYCGNYFQKGSIKTVTSDCYMTCGGDAKSLCGAGNRLQIYQYEAVALTPAAMGRLISMGSPTVANATRSVTDLRTATSYSSTVSISNSNSTISISAASSKSASNSTSNTPNMTPVTTARANTFSTFPNGTVSATVVATQGNKNLMYLGCFVEINGRVLNEKSYTNGTNVTVLNCLSFCSDYLYAGLKSHKQCFCGNKLRNSTKHDDSRCSDKCTDDVSESCGSDKLLNIYKISTTDVKKSYQA